MEVKIQVIFWTTSIVVAITTAIIALANFRKSILERKLDLRWKQATAAKEFMAEIHTHKFSGAAISMLDWFEIGDDDNFDKKRITEKIKYEEVLAAMPKVINETCSDREHYILECFDWFFYHIDRTEQHIADGLFLFENVKFIFFPYYKKIRKHKGVYENFMKKRYYFLAPDFWGRFENDPKLKILIH
jgi:hypothetical protein